MRLQSEWAGTVRALLCLVVAVGFLSACGGGGGGGGGGMVIMPTAAGAPVAVGTIPDQDLTVGTPGTVDVSGSFRDPNGDALAYTAASSDASTATVSLSGSTVTITPVSEGTTTVTVTATDPGNLRAMQTIAVTVSAAGAPVAIRTIPTQALTVGTPGTVDVSDAFRNPLGGALTYAAAPDDTGVATARVSGSIVTITPVSSGTTSVMVTATNSGGGRGTLAIPVTVLVGTNIGEDPGAGGGDIAFTLVWTHSGSSRAEGPDIDIWVQEPSGLSSNLLSASRDGASLGPTTTGGQIDHDDIGGWGAGDGGGPERAFWPSGQLPPAGVYTYGVRYFQGNGTANYVLRVYVDGVVVQTRTGTLTAPGARMQIGTYTLSTGNRAPTRVGTISHRVLEVGNSVMVNLSASFSDPEGSRLTYEATSGSSSTVRVSVSGNILTLTPVRVGTVRITVIATDPGGRSIAQDFTVEVILPSTTLPSTIQTISVDQVRGTGSATGNIAVADEQDWFRVTLTSGTRYRFDVEGSSTSSTSVGVLPDPYLRLLDSSVTELTANDDGGIGLNARIEFTPASSGIYYLVVRGFRTETGTYTLTVTIIR